MYKMITGDETVVIVSSSDNLKHNLGGKLAMFDLDGTIITTASGKVHPKDISDWQWKYDSILKKLTKLGTDGYSVVIISNQAGVSAKKIQRCEIEEKLSIIHNEIMDNCELPMLEIYAALEKDLFRKPNTKIYETYIFPRITEPKKIFYVGDAAGRAGDFSDTDRKFAYNIMKYNYFMASAQNIPDYKKTYRVGFYTPEEYFLKSAPEAKQWRGFDPEAFMRNIKTLPDHNPSISELIAEPKLVILMVGAQASGKTTLAKKMCAARECVYISQDELGNKKNCMKKYRSALAALAKQTAGMIVIDNTNPSVGAREEYLREIDIDLHVQVKIINMTTPRDICEHMNIVRERITGKKHVPTVAFNKFYKSYEAPDTTEGTVINYDFRPVFKKKYHLLMFLQKTDSK